MSFRSLAALAFAAVTLAAATSAQAISFELAPTVYRGGISYFPFTSSSNGFSSFDISHSDLAGTVSASSKDLKVQIVGSNSDTGSQLIAEAHMKYYFVLLSAFPNDIHVLIDASAQAGGAGSYWADAGVGIHAKDGTLNQSLAHAYSCSSGSNCGGPFNHGSDGGLMSVTLAANKIYSINLDVIGRTTNVSSSFSAFADPIISLDPDYSYASDIQIAFGEGVVGGSSGIRLFGADDGGGVPEPTTWALMLMGFGTVGALLRRRELAVA